MNLEGTALPKVRKDEADDGEAEVKVVLEKASEKGTKEEACDEGEGPREESEVVGRRMMRGRGCEEGMGAAAPTGRPDRGSRLCISAHQADNADHTTESDRGVQVGR